MKARRLIVPLAVLGAAVVCSILYTRFRAETGIDRDYRAPASRPSLSQAAPATSNQGVGPLASVQYRAPASFAPAPLARPAEGEPEAHGAYPHRSRLRVLETLSSNDSAPLRDGSVIRTQIVRARFKYPMVRIEERLAPSGQSIAQREMVADHVLVQLQEGATIADLQAVLSRQAGFSIRKAVASPGLFVVAFEGGTDPSRMARVIQNLESERQIIARSEPDYIVRAN